MNDSLNDSKPIYREIQKFNRVLLFFALFFVDAATIGVCVQLYFSGNFSNEKGMMNVIVVIALNILLCAFVTVLFIGMRLITEVRSDGVYIRFVPFHFKFQRIGFDTIKNCEARTYRPLIEYGGWGIRYRGFNSKAYNISGNRGVQLVLNNDKRILIGSQRSDELAAAINDMMKNI